MSGPTNEDRAEWAHQAIETFQAATHMQGEDDATIIGDLLANIMHYCRLNDIDFEARLANGRMHFEAEVEEEEGDEE